MICAAIQSWCSNSLSASFLLTAFFLLLYYPAINPLLSDGGIDDAPEGVTGAPCGFADFSLGDWGHE